VHCIPQIAAPLHVQPEIGAVAKHTGKDERGRGGDVSAVVAQLIDVLNICCFGSAAIPLKDRAPSFVDADRMEPFKISAQLFEVVTGRHP